MIHQIGSWRLMSADRVSAISVWWHWPRQCSCEFCGSNHCDVQNESGPLFICWVELWSWIKCARNRIITGFGGCLSSFQNTALDTAAKLGRCASWTTMFMSFSANAGSRCYVCCERTKNPHQVQQCSLHGDYFGKESWRRYLTILWFVCTSSGHKWCFKSYSNSPVFFLILERQRIVIVLYRIQGPRTNTVQLCWIYSHV